MSVWDLYEAQANVRGLTKRSAALRREKRYINVHAKDNLSYFTVDVINTLNLQPGIGTGVLDTDISQQEVEIINSDNMEMKYVITMPGNTLRMGDLIHWMDQYWMVTSKDFNTELHTKVVVTQCNYLVRWVDSSGTIYEQWSIVEDGTKYLTGEYEDKDFFVTRGDARVAITLPRSSVTAKMGRDTRLLVDEPGRGELMAFLLTKPLRAGLSYGDEDGVYKFIMQEVVNTDDDNFDLRIADYYKYYDKPTAEQPTKTIIDPDNNTTDNGREMWL